MKKISISFLLMVIVFLPARAQYEKLNTLPGHSANIYFSSGSQQRAQYIARLVDSAMNFYSNQLKLKPEVDLLVLSVADWPLYTSMPVIGMPHYDNTNSKKLVVAAEDNAFWKSFIPPLDKIDPSMAGAIKATYSLPDGSVSMESFFDLLALHELAHAFHMQAGINMQRKWMGELFVNMMLHSFVAEKMPQLLPALTVFPKMVVAGGSASFTYKKLQDIEERYEEIGSRYPNNYGWFQSRWHMAAGTIYDNAGSAASVKLWNALQQTKQKLADEELIKLLAKADPSIAAVMMNWDADTR